MTTSKGKLDAVYPALLAIFNNIAAYVETLGPVTCSKILQLFASMSAPSFLLANETNHALLFSLLEGINSILEHQFKSKFESSVLQKQSSCQSENSYLVYAILKSRKRFEALRTFTLESGQQEIERQNQLRKQNSSSQDAPNTPLSPSTEDLRRLSGARSPPSHIPEETGPFAIGGDDSDEEGEIQNTPSQSSPSLRHSRTPSIASSVGEGVPLQTRGMSEKARGKMPAGQMSFSRQNSTTSLSSHGATVATSSTHFSPTATWVCFHS